MLDLDAEVNAALPVRHFEVLTVAAGATSHRIQLLLGHDHHTPMLGRVQSLEVVDHSTCCVFRVALRPKCADEELLAKLHKLVVHVHLLLDGEEAHRLIWLWHTRCRDWTLVYKKLLLQALHLPRIDLPTDSAHVLQK